MPGGQFSLKNIITEIAILWKHFFSRGGGAGGGGGLLHVGKSYYYDRGKCSKIMTGESLVLKE